MLFLGKLFVNCVEGLSNDAGFNWCSFCFYCFIFGSYFVLFWCNVFLGLVMCACIDVGWFYFGIYFYAGFWCIGGVYGSSGDFFEGIV
jgi:hypothetical protein